MKFHKWRKYEIFPFLKMAAPQANSLREFAVKLIKMINSDPKWEIKSIFLKEKLIYFSTRVQ